MSHSFQANGWTTAMEILERVRINEHMSWLSSSDNIRRFLNFERVQHHLANHAWHILSV